MRKKDILAELLYRSGAANIAAAMSQKNTTLPILAYHRILPLGNNFEFDDELISATPENFDWQMNYLHKYYNPLNFRQLIELVDRGEPLPPRAVMVTFDDGFDDNFYYAYPILKKYNVPATFYISTDYIGTDKVFWFDWTAYLCKKLQDDVTLIAPLSGREFILSAQDAAHHRCEKLLDDLKKIPDADRKGIISQLEDIVNPAQKSFAESRAMTWQQVQEIQQSGIVDFGSHTVSHPILSRLEKNAITYELKTSKQIIEDKLQAACPTLAYPVGGRMAINEDVLDSVAISGYRYACTYRSGFNTMPLEKPFELKRLHIERYTSKAWFAAMLAMPALFQ